MGAIRVVRGGGAILIFPEGSRSPDGKLQPAQPGIGMIMAKTGAPVVPVRVSGSFQAFPRGTAVPHFVAVKVTIGAPILFEGSETEDRAFYQKASDRIMDAVAAL